MTNFMLGLLLRLSAAILIYLTIFVGAGMLLSGESMLEAGSRLQEISSAAPSNSFAAALFRVERVGILVPLYLLVLYTRMER